MKPGGIGVGTGHIPPPMTGMIERLKVPLWAACGPEPSLHPHVRSTQMRPGPVGDVESGRWLLGNVGFDHVIIFDGPGPVALGA